jgi:hypothetical protein
MKKPDAKLSIGMDALPFSIKNSKILTGNNLVELGNVQKIPAVDASYNDERLKDIIQYYAVNPDEMENELHIYAKELLTGGKLKEAWQVLITLNS